ncbi:pyrimidine-nucleoside phosphorylase [Pullulanibacillus sp. KACC 23026]|uniref:pyrimidine-nucleoside phosphorylase n=1 Tax=Pullulanibacillus sp. KACC 23026 TaxID=3028315 RepID=UPI0023AF135C|nr:pyrimidine-nucleoside phosphorylase [Pullulanibacillus sp. KACC 23026]WEG11449.1 pyrimidine-nucleoside phosphorylase [Pullulanibacillus sp. KACC 23026]
MRMVDLIQKKRDQKTLATEEINWLIRGVTDGTIPDYQVSAWLMAVYFNGMSRQETRDLTQAIVQSGDTIQLNGIKGIKVDKHSTGGVGDKTSLIVGPLVAAAGVPVAKMSGRGLGHTGGTVDKLESIAGFHTELDEAAFIEHVNKYKLAIVGQTGQLAPADKKLYAMRDVTATVDSIPLIASSIMGKKLASGADAIILDVKVGNGAFMKTLDKARELAEQMVEIGKGLGKPTIAILSDMNEPLGYEVGNANEVKEAIEVLKGNGEPRLTELCLTIASHMTILGGVYPSLNEARQALEEILHSGKALNMLRTFVEAQGGDPLMIDQPDKLPQAPHQLPVLSDKEGIVESIQADEVGLAAMKLGAGRETKEGSVDHSVGITLVKKVGDRVEKGETLAFIHAKETNPVEALNQLKEAYSISDESPSVPPIIYEIIQ